MMVLDLNRSVSQPVLSPGESICLLADVFLSAIVLQSFH